LLLLIGAGVVLAGIVAGNTVSSHRQALKPEVPTITIPWLPATVKHWHKPIEEMAKKYSIDPNLIAIIVTLESGGYSKAESEAGAQGLMQVTPPTAKDIAAKHLKEPRKTYNLLEPRTNIEFGTAYLAWLRDEFGTAKQGPDWNVTVELLAAGYNGGPGAANNIEQGKGLLDTQTVVYSRDAFNMWRERRAHKSPTFDRWKERGGTLLLDQAKTEQQ
jgi:soluble lytic murein transglycosylase-like protein